MAGNRLSCAQLYNITPIKYPYRDKNYKYSIKNMYDRYEHNKEIRSDAYQIYNYNGDLYEPLRNALKKSMNSQHDPYIQKRDYHYLENSHVAKASRSLSSS